MLYLISITFFFFIGGAFAGLIRLELLTPQPDLMASDTYNKIFSMHGIIMVFLFLVPSVPATLGNFLMPIMLGAKDLAFPKINLLSWYLYLVGGMLTLAALVLGGVDTGWTFTTPLSTHYLNTHVMTAATCCLHRGLLVDLYRAELYRDDSPDAGAGNDVVPDAAVCLVALCCFDPDGAGYAGAGDYAGAGGAGADGSGSGSSIRPRAAIRCCSNISSGSTRIRRCTS